MAKQEPSDLSLVETQTPRASAFDVAMAVLLGAAAVLSAFSALRASLIGDEMLEGFTQSTQFYNDALALEGDNTQAAIQDQQLFLQYLRARQDGSAEWADMIRGSMFDGNLEAAVAWWERQSGADDSAQSPFDSGTPYKAPYDSKIEQLYQSGDASYSSAKRADQRGDYFDIAVAISSITLFTGGLAALLHKRATRDAMVVIALATLVISIYFALKGELS